ncbi:hypothetical protein P171DRAFT_442157 [Karstenula rhodostoma CBS 690.94]|uniref:Uncharacterized protein n=1 Tax=Karstenula rhodostoma CBS 690.94 TaxID=1392251 RepID=A0A9P4PN14_9PLEO|nr:hypothetical protein P171DRAFT_442157 [Karstenula rhodostoma CBS 690.94]
MASLLPAFAREVRDAASWLFAATCSRSQSGCLPTRGHRDCAVLGARASAAGCSGALCSQSRKPPPLRHSTLPCPSFMPGRVRARRAQPGPKGAGEPNAPSCRAIAAAPLHALLFPVTTQDSSHPLHSACPPPRRPATQPPNRPPPLLYECAPCHWPAPSKAPNKPILPSLLLHGPDEDICHHLARLRLAVRCNGSWARGWSIHVHVRLKPSARVPTPPRDAANSRRLWNARDELRPSCSARMLGLWHSVGANNDDTHCLAQNTNTLCSAPSATSCLRQGETSCRNRVSSIPISDRSHVCERSISDVPKTCSRASSKAAPVATESPMTALHFHNAPPVVRSSRSDAFRGDSAPWASSPPL